MYSKLANKTKLVNGKIIRKLFIFVLSETIFDSWKIEIRESLKKSSIPCLWLYKPERLFNAELTIKKWSKNMGLCKS